MPYVKVFGNGSFLLDVHPTPVNITNSMSFLSSAALLRFVILAIRRSNGTSVGGAKCLKKENMHWPITCHGLMVLRWVYANKHCTSYSIVQCACVDSAVQFYHGISFFVCIWTL